MPSITIGTTSKRLNSTSTSFSGTNLSCKLKNPCGMQSPVFEVKGLSKGTFYNYASFEGRYYWVDEIVYLTNDIQAVHCTLDPLATFKSAIQATSAMVIYGDSTNWSKLIDDVRVEPELRLSTQTIANENMFGLSTDAAGCIAMTFTSTTSVDWITQASSLAGTGVHTALLSVSEMRKCIGDLTGFDPGQGISGSGLLEMLEAFGRVIQSLGGGSIADYIQRIIWIPFKLSDIVAATAATYRLGMFVGGVLADQCEWYDVNPGVVYTHDGNFTIDWNTLTGSHDFMKNPRWISLQVYTPGGFQDIPLNCAKFTNTLYYKTSFSITDGSWNMRLCSNSALTDTLTTFSGNISVDMLGTVNLGNQFSATIADAGASFVGGAVAMGMGSIASGAASMSYSKAAQAVAHGEATQNQNYQVMSSSQPSGIDGSIPKTSFNVTAASGQFSGAGSLFLTTTPAAMIVYAQCYMPYTLGSYTNYCNEYGYPVNKFLQLSSVTGFCKCAGASVKSASNASPANLATINSYLNSGIYLE